MKDFYIIHFDKLDSTNDYLKENYQKLVNNTVISTSFQEKGKGRLGRIWQNKPNKDLALSILIKNNFLDFNEYSLIAGASVYLTLKELGINSKIKWPNDILINDKKVSGILCEAISYNQNIECVIVGIGININSTGFNISLKNKATSLLLQTSNHYNIDNIENMLLENFKNLYNKALFSDKEYLEICRKNSYLTNKEIDFIYKNENRTGQVLEILENGDLYVKSNNEYLQLNSGEVTLSKNYK